LIAGNACPDFAKDEMVMNVSDRWARQWLRSGDGRAWLEANDMPRNPFFAPDRECSASDPRPALEFTSPTNGSVITESPLPISGVIDVRNGGSFTNWRLEWGNGTDPQEWTMLVQGSNTFPQPELIYTWDLRDMPSNQITLRLYMTNGEEFYAERRIALSLNLPVPTATVTPTPTLVPPTAFPTDTQAPVVVPTETLTPFPATETKETTNP
jgi:hypothetical protein